MDKIWSPWRSQYIQSFKDKDKNKNTANDCFICAAVNSINSDKDLLIVTRRPDCIVMMNKYPYNSGHLLVCPNRHIADFQDFSNDELSVIMETIKEITGGMKQVFNPHGFNIGINIGQSAGAGLPEHLHFHIVPRWNGDCNFTATIADVKIISESIEDTRTKLATIFNK